MLGLNDLGGVVRSRYLVSLQYPEFRKLWGATVCSQSAAWALIVARAALVLNLTDRPEWTGYVTFAAMIPSVLMAPVAGFLADRFDRKTVLAWAYSINLGHNLVLAGLVASGHAEAWHVLLLAILNGSARSAQMPPAQALLPNMVPRERVLNAVSLYAATQHGSRFVGPFLILVVLWITGHQDWVFFVSAGLYALGLMQIVRIRTESTGLVEKGSGLGTIYRNMGAGLAYMYRTPFVLSIVLLVVAPLCHDHVLRIPVPCAIPGEAWHGWGCRDNARRRLPHVGLWCGGAGDCPGPCRSAQRPDQGQAPHVAGGAKRHRTPGPGAVP